MIEVQRPKILIVGGFTFSRGEAGSNTVIGYGKALERAGFRVEYLGDHGGSAPIREDFRQFTCHCPPEGRVLRGWKAAIVNLSASENRLLRWLSQVPAQEFRGVAAYPGGDLTAAALARLHRLCLDRGWKLAVIVGEWQGFWQFGGARLHQRVLALVNSEIERRVVNKKIKNIIAISRFLESYYKSSRCNAILVPPIVDCSAPKWDCRPKTSTDKRGLKLLFSGGWWRDRLDLIAKSVSELRDEGHDVVLEFLGSGPEDIGKDPQLRKLVTNAVNGGFRFHGKVPVERVLPITASADFGVLLRDRAKWAEACFPSKLVEFQALGVPMLCNLTSNLGEVLKDGQNALIVPEVSVSAFVKTVKRALALSPAERDHMTQCSLQCAARNFDYRVYSDTLGHFFTNPNLNSGV